MTISARIYLDIQVKVPEVYLGISTLQVKKVVWLIVSCCKKIAIASQPVIPTYYKDDSKRGSIP